MASLIQDAGPGYSLVQVNSGHIVAIGNAGGLGANVLQDESGNALMDESGGNLLDET